MKTIEEIIVEKEYNELTQDELSLVAELAENEQEYKAMRSLFAQMETEIIPDSAFVASENTKKSLDSIFMAKYPVIAQDWKKEEVEEEDRKIIPFYSTVWFRAAAVVLLFSGASYYYFQNSELNEMGGSDQNKKSLAIQTPSATKSPLLKTDENTVTEDVHTKTAQTSNEMEADKASVATTEPLLETTVAPISAGSESRYYAGSSLKDMGMSADLYPNGVSFEEEAADEVALKGSSPEVTTEDMLSWIQTLY